VKTATIPKSSIICPSGAGAYAGREDQYVWRFNTDTKEWLAPSRQQTYIDWLITPRYAREPKTLKEFCARLGVHEQTVYRWRKEKRFKDALRKAAEEKNYDTESIQDVVNSVHAAAVLGDMKAAALYLQYVKELQPVTRVIVEDKSVQSMSDEELISMLEEQLAALRGDVSA
jgi:transposase-like protein